MPLVFIVLKQFKTSKIFDVYISSSIDFVNNKKEINLF